VHVGGVKFESKMVQTILNLKFKLIQTLTDAKGPSLGQNF
jgi:hypothetical protein